MHYLKLTWSHGQQDLVENGFPAAMRFTDKALKARNEGVLIHCQCGISRSATLVIALVMRAAAESSPSVPPEVWALKGMQGAYSFVKSKSRWAGPNMSLIYQLLDYERRLDPASHGRSRSNSVSSSVAEDEEEWGRQRRLLDEAPSDVEDDTSPTEQHRVQNAESIAEEARALDKAMEERIVARKSSASSFASSTGVGMGPAWRSRYGAGSTRKRERAGSIASNMTSAGNSVLSEDLVEEDEEQELLGVGGGFDDSDSRGRTVSGELESDAHSSPRDLEDRGEKTCRANTFLQPAPKPQRRRLNSNTPTRLPVPPSAPVWKTSFSNLPPQPFTAMRSSFDLPPVPKSAPRALASTTNLKGKGLAGKRRPPPLGLLPPVPPSPVALVTENSVPSSPSGIPQAATRVRTRTESRKPAPPPLHIFKQSTTSAPKTPPHSHHAHSHSVTSFTSSRSSNSNSSSTQTRSRKSSLASSSFNSHPHAHHLTNPMQPPPTATQTLFVFPPEPASMMGGMMTPSTMTLVSTPMPGIPFPSLSVSGVTGVLGDAKKGKRRSWIAAGGGVPMTPTTACSRVDARGWVGM